MSCSNNSCCKTNQAGKGDKPRNCFSKSFKDNYDEIDWSHHKKGTNLQKQDESKQQKSP
jgi:hypothetical protein